MVDIAFVGLGRMGAPMRAALVRASYQVTATDKRAECEPFAHRVRDQLARHGSLQLFVGGEASVLEKYRGRGLTGLQDRVDAAGGTLTIASDLGVGTTLRASLPVDTAPA